VRAVAMIVGALAGGCLHPASITCGDGTVCPDSKVCDPRGNSCVAQDQLDACEKQSEDANCTASSIGDGVCVGGVCETVTWSSSAVIGGNILATSVGLRVVSVAVDRIGNAYVTEPFRVRRIDTAGVLTTLAGTGVSGFSGDGAVAATAQLWSAAGVAVDGLGNVYIADTGNYRIRRVDASTGIITTFAGNGNAGYLGEGLLAVNSPIAATSLAVDGVGNVYLGEPLTHRVRRVDVATGLITTVAGNGMNGTTGDNGPATAAKIDTPAAVAIDAIGNVFFADMAANRVRRIDVATNIITTVAGNGTPGSTGDGGDPLQASLSSPQGIAIDSTGNLMIADTGGARIRRVDASTNTIMTVAGTVKGFAGDGASASDAKLASPEGAAFDGQGDLFIADVDNHRIRRIDAATGTIATIAGNGDQFYAGDGAAATSVDFIPGSAAFDRSGGIVLADYYGSRVRRVDLAVGIMTTVVGTGIAGDSGDGGLATDAQVKTPSSVAIDSRGQLYVADADSNRIRQIDAQGIITTIAGTGGAPGFSGDGGPATSALLAGPSGLSIDAVGNICFIDFGNVRVRCIDSSGTIRTVAGNGSAGPSGDGGLATSVTLDLPTDTAIDVNGNVYIADGYSHRIRRVDATTGIITTVAGLGSVGFSGDGLPATSAQLNHPTGVRVDGAGNLYIADSNNHRIRRVDASSGTISTIAGSPGDSGDGGPALQASFAPIAGLDLDPAGNYLVIDNGRVRRVDVATGIIKTVAGAIDPFGMGPRAQAQLGDPRALAVTSSLMFVAGGATGTVQEYRNGWLATAVGRYPETDATGMLARFRDRNFGAVLGVAFDPSAGKLYLSESRAATMLVPPTSQIHVVSLVDLDDPSTWTIAPIVDGTPGYLDGGAGGARFDQPTGLYFDAATHQLYVADTGNEVIRRIDLDTLQVATIAGSPRMLGFLGDGGPATSALLYQPQAVTKCAGDLFIADTGNHRVRRINETGVITTVLGNGTAVTGGGSSIFAVDTPLGLACDAVGNLFVTSRTSVLMLEADSHGVVDGNGKVRTIFGAAHDAFPASVTRCLTGVAVVDPTKVNITDSCTGMLIELDRAN
jgi:sugar lactone lactonase YvrE